MQNTNLTPRSKANVHGNIIVKSEYAHLINEDENQESSKRHIDPYNESTSNIHGQHRIPRYVLDNLDNNSPRSMQANAERSQLERELSYQKHLKSRLDSKFTSHERTLSRLSISIANQSEVNKRRSNQYNNNLVDSLDAGMLEDSLDIGHQNEPMSLNIRDLDPDTNVHMSDRAEVAQYKPDSAAVSDYGYGPIDRTPIVDKSIAMLAKGGDSGEGEAEVYDGEDDVEEPSIVKRSSPESTPFTRGGHAWSNKEHQPVPSSNQAPMEPREDSRLYKAQQERAFLEEQVNIICFSYIYFISIS